MYQLIFENTKTHELKEFNDIKNVKVKTEEDVKEFSKVQDILNYPVEGQTYEINQATEQTALSADWKPIRVNVF